MKGNGRAQLVSTSLGTLVLHWWPGEVAWSRQGRWEEQERVGRTPLLLGGNIKTAELRVSYLLREADGVTDVGRYLRWLDRALDTKDPLMLWLGASFRGLFRMKDLSVVEVRHNKTGAVSVADVSFTLAPAQDIELSVGPVKTRRRRRNRGRDD